MKFFIVAVVGLIFASSVSTEEVTNFRMCRNTRCEVYDMFIDPCAEAVENKPCEIPQGVNSTITFKYISKFGSPTPKTRLYAETLLLDLPFLDMNTDACLYTKCPLEANVEKSWEYHLFIADKYPKGGYTVKLKFWDNQSHHNGKDECCFKFDIAIV